jgi:hypothetical protein
MQANVYTRERKHIESIQSNVTCLALLLATQSLAHRAPVSSRSHQRLMIATGKQTIQANKYKQYTK